MIIYRRLSLSCLCLLYCLCALATAPGIHAQRAPQNNVRVTILHLNNVRQFTPVRRGEQGGLARVSTLRKQLLRDSPHTLLILSGDTLSPSVESTTYKGRQMIDAWNQVGLDYAAFGEHDFDFGPAVLRERVAESRFKWLAANVVDKRTGRPFADASAFEVREFGGVKLGIFGLLTPETKETSLPGPDVDITDPFRAAAEAVRELRRLGAQTIIAVTHLSVEQDQELARRTPSIDLIIGGRTSGPVRTLSGVTPIFKVPAEARFLGQVDLSINPASGETESIDATVIPVTSEIADDPQFAAVYEKYPDPEYSQVVGRSGVPLDARREVNNTAETNVGNLIADAFRNRMRAEVALVNADSIGADDVIPPGPLTMRDVLLLQPYGYEVVKLRVSGAALRRALEHSVGGVGSAAQTGRFLQVSGLRFSFDATRPPGSRIVSATVAGKTLKDEAKYTVATNSFLRGGGAGYEMLREPVEFGAYEAGPASSAFAPHVSPSIKRDLLFLPVSSLAAYGVLTDSQVLLDLIKAAGAIAPKIEGRISRVDRGRAEQL